MSVILRGVTTVLLPGTGSDDDFVYRAFSDALHGEGAVVVTEDTVFAGFGLEGFAPEQRDDFMARALEHLLG